MLFTVSLSISFILICLFELLEVFTMDIVFLFGIIAGALNFFYVIGGILIGINTTSYEILNPYLLVSVACFYICFGLYTFMYLSGIDVYTTVEVIKYSEILSVTSFGSLLMLDLLGIIK